MPNKPDRIMILPSCDGQDYVTLIGVPDEWSERMAAYRFRKVRDRVIDQNVDGWTWDDMEQQLYKAGFRTVNWIRGPIWDIHT